MEGESNKNLEAEVMEITPEVNTDDMVEGTVVFDQNNPEAITDVNPELTALNQIDIETAVDVLNNNPEKAARFSKNVEIIKSVMNILGDAAAIAIGAYVMKENTDIRDHLIANVPAVTAAVATVVSGFKLAWDLAGFSFTKSNKAAKPQTV